MTSHNNDDKYGKGSNSLFVLTMTPSFTFALLTTETVRRLNVPGKPLLVATSSGFGLFTTIFRYVSFQAWPKATSTKGSWSRGRGEWHNRQSVSIIIRAQGEGSPAGGQRKGIRGPVTRSRKAGYQSCS